MLFRVAIFEAKVSSEVKRTSGAARRPGGAGGAGRWVRPPLLVLTRGCEFEPITWGARHPKPRVFGADVLRSPGRERGRGSRSSRHDAGCVRLWAPLTPVSRTVDQRAPRRPAPWPFGAQESLPLSLAC